MFVWSIKHFFLSFKCFLLQCPFLQSRLTKNVQKNVLLLKLLNSLNSLKTFNCVFTHLQTLRIRRMVYLGGPIPHPLGSPLPFDPFLSSVSRSFYKLFQPSKYKLKKKAELLAFEASFYK